MSSNHPADWYPDPADTARLRYWDGQQWTEHCTPATTPKLQQPPPMARSQKWSTAETFATLGAILVLMPVASYTSRAVVDAGASPWAVAAVATAIAAAAVVLKSGTGRARDGVLFGVYLTLAVTAIVAVAEALDVWEMWVMIAVLVPVLAVQQLRSRSRAERRALPG